MQGGEEYPFPSIKRARQRRQLVMALAVVAVIAGLAWLVKVQLLDMRPRCTATTDTKCVETRGNPQIFSTSPSKGGIAGGDTVTITGTRFGPGVQVWFGDQPAARIAVQNSIMLQAVVPKAPWPQQVDVSVSRGDGPRQILYKGYRYTSYFSITSLTPASGPTSGGTAVTIIGSGFSPDTLIEVDGIKTLRATYVDQYTMRVLMPRHDPGPVDVRLFADGQSAIKTAGFTYQ